MVVGANEVVVVDVVDVDVDVDDGIVVVVVVVDVVDDVVVVALTEALNDRGRYRSAASIWSSSLMEKATFGIRLDPERIEHSLRQPMTPGIRSACGFDGSEFDERAVANL